MNFISNNPLIVLIKYSWSFSTRSAKKNTLILYILLFLANICGSLYPLLYGWFVESLQSNNNIIESVTNYAFLYFVLTLLYWIFHGPARLLQRRTAFQISSNILICNFRNIIERPLSWKKSNHSAALINRLNKGFLGIRTFIDHGFIYYQTFIQLIVAIVAVVYFSSIFGIIATLLGCLAIWLNLKFDRPYIKHLEGINDSEHKLFSMVSDGITNVLTIKTLKLENQFELNLLNKVQNIYKPFKKSTVVGESKWFVANILSTVIYIVIITGYVTLNRQSLVIGELVALIGFVHQFTTSYNAIVSQYSNIIQIYSDVNSLKNIDIDIPNQKKFREKANLNNWKYYRIEGLRFNYNSDRNHETTTDQFVIRLKDQFLSLEKGTKIAIIGSSGSGKSTLLSLLKGINKPDANPTIYCDTNQKIEWEEFTASTMLFPQDPEIFESSIIYNLTLGLDFNQKDIQKACQIACIEPFINELPNSYNSEISEKGSNISGGQKQRLAIARGILATKEQNILLLDEPTSNVDEATELQIFKNIFCEFNGKCIVAIVHNLELLQYFDRCFLMKEGLLEEVKNVHQTGNYRSFL